MMIDNIRDKTREGGYGGIWRVGDEKNSSADWDKHRIEHRTNLGVLIEQYDMCKLNTGEKTAL